MQRTVWTIACRPFTMGGVCNYPITTEVKIIEERAIGKGYKAFSFKTPKGTLRIAESTTGGIVADTFDELIKDVKAATKSDIQDQIKAARETLKSPDCKKLSNEEFFQLYRY
jgi:hypothetical protein